MPIDFAFKLYPLQQEIFDYLDGKILNEYGEPYRFFVAALGRQTGKSWLDKYISLEYAANRDATVMWVAPTIPTARSHWNDLVTLIRKSGMVEGKVVTKLSQASKEIHFKQGGSISVRSAIEPDNLRGASLDLLILDEAAFFRDGNYVWYSVCLPMVTATKGKVLFTTTPNGRNWLYELYKRGKGSDEITRQDNGDGTFTEYGHPDRYYKSWNFNAYISPYQDKALLDDLKTSMPSQQWREEFLAEFLADGGGVFAGVERAATVEWVSSPLPLHRYVMGIDIGHTNDSTCLTVIDTTTHEQVWGESFTGIGSIDTTSRILSAIKQWQPDNIVVEKNGGEYFVKVLKNLLSGRDNAEDLEAIWDRSQWTTVESIGRFKVTAVHMTNELKRSMVERLSSDIEYGRLNILSDDTKYGDTQISEMSTFERNPTNSGMEITYRASDGNHDDTVSALYLAYSSDSNIRVSKRINTKRKATNPFRSTSGGRNLNSIRRRGRNASSN